MVNFRHSDMTVPVGTTVEWINRDRVQHTSTAGTGPGNLSGVWQSPELRQDKTSAFSFNEVGEFPYFCEIHGLSMTGTVTVVESGGKISVGSASAEETPTSGLPGYYED